MNCAWKELLGILPPAIRRDVDSLGRDRGQCLRLRLGQAPELCCGCGSRSLPGRVTGEDLQYVVNAASRYSPWNAATAARGYLTAPGGHRIGLCGEAVVRDGAVTGIRELTSLCIRIARDFPGIAAGLGDIRGSVLILGAPGWGKTTLLRDLIRQISLRETVAVVDEREELFPRGFDRGCHTDVLSGCAKDPGLDMVIRTMGPASAAVDEITSQADTQALLRGANCGVRLLAAAHAASPEEFRKRQIYRPLVEAQIFSAILMLHADQTMERMDL